MAVAKRQGRSEDQSEDFRQNKQNKQHSWLSPLCIGHAQVEEKTYKRRSQSAFSRTLSPAFVRSRSLSQSLSLPTHSSTLFSSSCNTDLPKSCGTVCPRPKSCDTPRALMSVAPNFCCDETKNRGTYTHMTDINSLMFINVTNIV